MLLYTLYATIINCLLKPFQAEVQFELIIYQLNPSSLHLPKVSLHKLLKDWLKATNLIVKCQKEKLTIKRNKTNH